MKKLSFFFALVSILLVAWSGGCGINNQPAVVTVAPSTPTLAPAVQQPTASLIPTATIVPSTIEVKIVGTVTPAGPILSALVPDALSAGMWKDSGTECQYNGTGSSQPLKVSKEIKGLDGSKLWVVKLSDLQTCAYIFEGRTPWQRVYQPLIDALAQSQVTNPDGTAWDPWNTHLIIDLRSPLGRMNVRQLNELAKDIIPAEHLDDFVYSGGSLWAYDPTWNMSDFKPAKPSIGEELEVKKFRDAMVPDGHNDPRVIMQPNGALFVFWMKDSGDTAYSNGTAAGCTKGNQPEIIPVYGAWNGSEWEAAIGAGACKMAYWADGSTTPVVWSHYQKDGKEIVKYQTGVLAVIFPANWTDSQVTTWIEAHPGGK